MQLDPRNSSRCTPARCAPSITLEEGLRDTYAWFRAHAAQVRR